MKKILSLLNVGQVFQYFFRVFKKDKEGKYPVSTNLKMMHGINKISIVMFLICLIVLMYRAFTRE